MYCKTSIKDYYILDDVSEQTLCLIFNELAKELFIPANKLVYTMTKHSVFNKSSNTEITYNKEDDIEKVYKNGKAIHKAISNKLIEESKGFYIIVSGKCEVRSMGEVIGVIEEKDWFGESEFLGTVGYNYLGDISTLEDCCFLYIKRKSLERIPFYDRNQMQFNVQRNKDKFKRMLSQGARIHRINPYKKMKMNYK